uniref:Uncharacterized protein n=1 Tax=Pithovirus LCPAC101 TaxID=2506586 RepID=A0A481Z2S3_9VIRU|nr:MAG: hypothetical protein LCPAC101_03180 [Pithovirus LCPAC101]
MNSSIHTFTFDEVSAIEANPLIFFNYLKNSRKFLHASGYRSLFTQAIKKNELLNLMKDDDDDDDDEEYFSMIELTNFTCFTWDEFRESKHNHVMCN